VFSEARAWEIASILRHLDWANADTGASVELVPEFSTRTSKGEIIPEEDTDWGITIRWPGGDFIRLESEQGAAAVLPLTAGGHEVERYFPGYIDNASTQLDLQTQRAEFRLVVRGTTPPLQAGLLELGGGLDEGTPVVVGIYAGSGKGKLEKFRT
jgi:hypothetical protein